jgi:hypothetical protein
LKRAPRNTWEQPFLMLVALMNKRPPLVLVDTNVTLVENTWKKRYVCIFEMHGKKHTTHWNVKAYVKQPKVRVRPMEFHEIKIYKHKVKQEWRNLIVNCTISCHI